MRFRFFRRGAGSGGRPGRRAPGRSGHEAGTGRAEPCAWRESGLADEVEAFLAGRLADLYAAAGRPPPPWVAINRLAHAGRDELLHVVEGERVPPYLHPSIRAAQWRVTERFVAGALLAQARTPEELAAIQREALVPVELALIERSKVERLTPEAVIEAGAEALDARHPDA
ncbi:MAG TPA: hypothetical protein VIL48_05720 [Acidimicrobiales bacterium]